jgi:hypothetical protein
MSLGQVLFFALLLDSLSNTFTKMILFWKPISEQNKNPCKPKVYGDREVILD